MVIYKIKNAFEKKKIKKFNFFGPKIFLSPEKLIRSPNEGKIPIIMHI